MTFTAENIFFLGAVLIFASILDEQGNIDLAKLQPVIFDSAKNEYRVVGEKVGTAWGSGKAIQEREVK